MIFINKLTLTIWPRQQPLIPLTKEILHKAGVTCLTL